MNLLIEYFRSPDYQRHSEYLTCIHENLENENIKKIYIFISDDSKLNFQSEKIEIVKREERPSYKDLFEFCNENLKDEICIVSNADIIFDESLSVIANTELDKKFIALTRWEVFSENNEWCIAPYENSSSQDVWVFKTPVFTSDEMEFLLGKPGCDNKIAKIMADNGYELKNPGKQIVTAHFHMSGFRTYNGNDRIPGPYIVLFPNDNIDGPTETLEIDGFDQFGRAYKIQKEE
jgi:hypothetical protein